MQTVGICKAPETHSSVGFKSDFCDNDLIVGFSQLSTISQLREKIRIITLNMYVCCTCEGIEAERKRKYNIQATAILTVSSKGDGFTFLQGMLYKEKAQH